jgi:arabinofuranosyltransferase
MTDSPRSVETLKRGSIHWGMVAALIPAAMVLVLHLRLYGFLCDDAFISFRYARNLASGFGLVFNPGFERVEGYSNFLWVMLLAGFDRIGVAPQHASIALSWLATLILWATVIGFAWRFGPARGQWWTVLAPAWLLAINRSFAVWGSSGLETRLFELLVVAGAMRLVVEVESAGARRLAPWAFALAALTRPDGLLFAPLAFGTEAFHRWRNRQLESGSLIRAWAAPALLVAAHLGFRRLYYGDWLPNTYYAKVGGRTWWSAGFDYLAAFTLEYAVWLWLPLIALGVVAFLRARRSFFPWLAGLLVIPHALYVAAIGGDHFEYRPLDLYLPFAFVLVGAGLHRLAVSLPRAGHVAGMAVLVVVAWASAELPWRSHVEFPARYQPGFPGRQSGAGAGASWLDPDRGRFYRLPGLRTLATWHREKVRASTARFVAIRQEEHERFLTEVESEGRRLSDLVAREVLPRDTHLAANCVGAIPYYSGLRTLDRLGLTDAIVARGPSSVARAMAHDRQATLEYARARDVDLWAADDVHFIHRAGSTVPIELASRRVAFHAADLGDGEYLLVVLPLGVEHAATRFPRLRFVPGASDAFLGPYLERSVMVLREALRRSDHDADRRQLALFLLLSGHPEQALREYQSVLERTPDDIDTIVGASECLEMLARAGEARTGLQRALELARARGDAALVGRIERRLAEMSSRPSAP